ncbi:MAG: PPC domain-containing DNA-binding protein [Weeksellaceae bacterium]
MENIEVIKGNTWQAKKLGNDYVVNIDFGEKLIASLEDFVKNQSIGSAEITGIGAANEVTLGFYDFEAKDYNIKTFVEQMEIANAMGNVAYKDEELYIHLHVTLGREDFSSYAGHLVEATIHGVAEFYVRVNPFKVIKTKNEVNNMWAYDFDRTEV